MTRVIVNPDRTVSYELTAPWFIGSNLRPTVKVGDDSTVSVWVAGVPTHSGARVLYGYEVRDNGRTIVTDTDISSGVGSAPDITSALGTLLSFADHYAECWLYHDAQSDGRPMNDDEIALGRWASNHEGDYFHLQYSEDGRELTDASVICIHCAQTVVQDAHGSWVDSTEGDGCDSPSGVHEAQQS